MTEPVEPKPEPFHAVLRILRPFFVSRKRPPCGAARPQPFSSFCINRSGFAVASSRGARRRISQNSQKGATLCSEFGKHR